MTTVSFVAHLTAVLGRSVCLSQVYVRVEMLRANVTAFVD
jgi:hypothetical protein